MTAKVLTRSEGQEIDERQAQVTHLDEVAETIRDDALALAREKLTLAERRANPVAPFDRADFVEHFKYGLASGVADALAANDARVQAIYVFDESLDQESEAGEIARPDDTVRLLAVVTSRSAGLEAFVAALERALAASLKELPSPRFAEREAILDVNLITEKDVRLGAGLAGMLSALFAPPIKIWPRAS